LRTSGAISRQKTEFADLGRIAITIIVVKGEGSIPSDHSQKWPFMGRIGLLSSPLTGDQRNSSTRAHQSKMGKFGVPQQTGQLKMVTGAG
jgi:hypothetical protein